jgi:predicted TIM-barrel fold metal-dependent hydrolase
VTDDATSETSPSVIDPPLIIVSSDSHIGPRMVEDLRPYCPTQYLEQYDAFVVDHHRHLPVFSATQGPNRITKGHFDQIERTRDMDYDGVAAEIIFHGSQNEEAIPFRTGGSFGDQNGQDLAMAAIGNRIYNRWLADFVSEDPDRHIGLVQLPMWDIDAALQELKWAAEHGLRGVNFPAIQPGILEYNAPEWDDFWSACEDLNLPLTTHSASRTPPSRYEGPAGHLILPLEEGGWYARRAMHWMVLSGVFERHPNLRLVLAEQPGQWWTSALREMDSVYTMRTIGSEWSEARQQIPRLPSEYCRSNVFIGASFLSRQEAEDAVINDYTENVLWGSDYPHAEGTYQYPRNWGDYPMTRSALRFTFAEIPAKAVRRMAGENAIRVYGLDSAKLTDVARRIAAPALAEITVPLKEPPEGAGVLAFRQNGPWS